MVQTRMPREAEDDIAVPAPGAAGNGQLEHLGGQMPLLLPCLGPGHRACQGCGEALGARLALDAARRAARAAGSEIVVVNATGCLEVFSSAYPYSSWNVPWLHSLFENAAAVASGVEAALRAQGRSDVRV